MVAQGVELFDAISQAYGPPILTNGVALSSCRYAHL
jgi:hypothetical protein